ncbi:MAG: NAD-dependent epimerase/dehydratase family protein [Beijerinckiaceae bacterium]
MHILVTGASGFVGQALCRRLLSAGHKITALVRQGSSAPVGCAALEHGLGDHGVLTLPKGLDGVAHLAQSRAYRAFPGDAAEMFRVNVAGAQQLLEVSAAAGVSRFCLVSTGTVYEPFLKPLDEDSPLAPTSYLGASKLAAEIVARPFGTVFPLSILRLFGPYGPDQTGRLVPDLIRRIRNGEAVTLPEHGGGMRFAPTHVDDICDLMAIALEQAWTGVYNVASPDALSIEEAAIIIGKAVGRSPQFERKPSAAPASAAPVVVPQLTRLAQTYDLARFRPFAAGIAAMISDTH